MGSDLAPWTETAHGASPTCSLLQLRCRVSSLEETQKITELGSNWNTAQSNQTRNRTGGTHDSKWGLL